MKKITISGCSREGKYVEIEISKNKIISFCKKCNAGCKIDDELADFGKLDCDELINQFYK